jgi:hypothetical protein
MPVEPALVVCDQLRLRFGLPKWQFTLAASTANIGALRIARVATGRDGVLLFEGKYAIATSGPHLGFAHVETDVDDHLTVLDHFLDELNSR